MDLEKAGEVNDSDQILMKTKGELWLHSSRGSGVTTFLNSNPGDCILRKIDFKFKLFFFYLSSTVLCSYKHGNINMDKCSKNEIVSSIMKDMCCIFQVIRRTKKSPTFWKKNQCTPNNLDCFMD